jgi:hypothetical protein
VIEFTLSAPAAFCKPLTSIAGVFPPARAKVERLEPDASFVGTPLTRLELLEINGTPFLLTYLERQQKGTEIIKS